MLRQYLTLWDTYRQARKSHLTQIGTPESQRDPMSEYSERVGLLVLGGELAESRVQPDFDLTRTTGATVQVKYLANPSGEWINERTVRFKKPDVPDECALLIFEDMYPRYLIVFKRASLARVCQRLGKTHGNKESTLQFTQANYHAMVDQPGGFEQLGVEFFPMTG